MKDLKKEMVDYKLSLLRDLYMQHEKPSTITVKKNAILKQMEELFNEVRGDRFFSDGLTFLQKVRMIVFSSDDLVFIINVEACGIQILYKKHNGFLRPCFRAVDNVENQLVLNALNEKVEVKVSKQIPYLNDYFRYEKTMLVFPKD